MVEGKEKVVLYTITDIQEIFKCGQTYAYQLCHTRGFPAFKINSRVYVPKDKLEKWIENNMGTVFRI